MRRLTIKVLYILLSVPPCLPSIHLYPTFSFMTYTLLSLLSHLAIHYTYGFGLMLGEPLICSTSIFVIYHQQGSIYWGGASPQTSQLPPPKKKFY